MRYAIALILLCSVFACVSPTAPDRHPQPTAASHKDVVCPVMGGGYVVYSGDVCPPQ